MAWGKQQMYHWYQHLFTLCFGFWLGVNPASQFPQPLDKADSLWCQRVAVKTKRSARIILWSSVCSCCLCSHNPNKQTMPRATNLVKSREHLPGRHHHHHHHHHNHNHNHNHNHHHHHHDHHHPYLNTIHLRQSVTLSLGTRPANLPPLTRQRRIRSMRGNSDLGFGCNPSFGKTTSNTPSWTVGNTCSSVWEGLFFWKKNLTSKNITNKLMLPTLLPSFSKARAHTVSCTHGMHSPRSDQLSALSLAAADAMDAKRPHHGSKD